MTVLYCTTIPGIRPSRASTTVHRLLPRREAKEAGHVPDQFESRSLCHVHMYEQPIRLPNPEAIRVGVARQGCRPARELGYRNCLMAWIASPTVRTVTYYSTVALRLLTLHRVDRRPDQRKWWDPGGRNEQSGAEVSNGRVSQFGPSIITLGCSCTVQEQYYQPALCFASFVSVAPSTLSRYPLAPGLAAGVMSWGG